MPTFAWPLVHLFRLLPRSPAASLPYLPYQPLKKLAREPLHNWRAHSLTHTSPASSSSASSLSFSSSPITPLPSLFSGVLTESCGRSHLCRLNEESRLDSLILKSSKSYLLHKYRETHRVSDLDWLDLDLGSSLGWWATTTATLSYLLPKQDEGILSQPSPRPRPSGSPFRRVLHWIRINLSSSSSSFAL